MLIYNIYNTKMRYPMHIHETGNRTHYRFNFRSHYSDTNQIDFLMFNLVTSIIRDSKLFITLSSVSHLTTESIIKCL